MASVDFDDILENIAKELFKEADINTLGKALEFGPADIGRYISANEKQGGTYMGTLAMLRSWRQGQTTTTERTELKSALLEGGFVKLADDLLGTPEPGQNQVAAASNPSPNTPAATDNRGRKPTDEEITELSGLLSYLRYSKFCGILGFKFNKHQGVLKKNEKDYPAAYEELLQEWVDGGKTIKDLDAALEKAELGGLIPQYKK